MAIDLRCAVCDGAVFSDRAILWDELAEAWGLSAAERAYVDRQQGTCCVACGASLRSQVLARAILAAAGATGTLEAFVASPRAACLAVLELNEAGSLSPVLRRLPGHRLGSFPEIDMQAMPYADGSFDLVIHSDTLEHVPDPDRALIECRRVLRPGGALCFTIPTIVGRMSRSRDGLPPSFHGFPTNTGEDLRVQTEFGADMWTYLLRAGFAAVTITPLEYPASLALTAWAGTPAPLLPPTREALARAALGAFEARVPRVVGQGARWAARRLHRLVR